MHYQDNDVFFIVSLTTNAITLHQPYIITINGRSNIQAALIEALQAGKIADAALDVFWYEPLHVANA